MSKITRYLLIASLAFIAASCTTLQYANMEKPEVTLVSISLAEVNWKEQHFDIAVQINNPNDFDLPITGVSYDMRLNGLKLGSGSSSGDVRIPALGEKLVQLKLSTAAWVWFRQYGQMRESRGALTLENMQYQISGKVFLEGLAVKSLPFVKEGDVALNRRK